MALEPLTSQSQQFGSGGEVPVCLARVDMAEIGRQQGQPCRWITAIAISVKKSADGERVPTMSSTT